MIIFINGKKINTKGGTVLEVAEKNKIDIPVLCNHPDLKPGSSCRICMVEINNKLVPACSTQVYPGVKIITDSLKIRKVRKINLELLFSQHKEECFDCVWNKECSLLDLAGKYKVKINRFDDRKKNFPVYQFGSVIQFDSSKCIDCKNCVVACHMQGVDFLEVKEKGSLFQVVPSKTKDCIYCGQCLTHCPAGAFESVGEFEDIEKPLKQKDKVVVFQFAPSIRSSIGEEFNMPYGSLATGKIVAGLKKLGVDKIFDTCVGADFTTSSEALEVVERIKKNKNLPVLTSCCPSWVKYLEQRYPELIPNISTTRSPQIILGSLIKTYWAKENNIDPKNIYSVSIMPCTAKKFEIIRPENNVFGMHPVDCVLTTREFARLLMRHNIDLKKLKPAKMDNMFSDPSGAGVIYGASGGVMESAFRTAYETLTNTKLKNVEFKQIRGMQGVKEADIKIKNKKRKIAVINGLGLAKEFLETKNLKDYTCIEVMACPGGCIGGGGQPIPTNSEIREKRALTLYSVDKKKKIRKAHENPIVKKVYKEYLNNDKIIHEVLHTSYSKKGRDSVKKI